MARRTSRRDDIDPSPYLPAMRECRAAMTQILARAEIRGPLYLSVTLAIQALDLVAKRMTGHDDALLDRMHSAGE